MAKIRNANQKGIKVPKSGPEKFADPHPDACIAELPEMCNYEIRHKIPVNYYPSNSTYRPVIARIADSRFSLEVNGECRFWLDSEGGTKAEALEKLVEGIIDIMDIFGKVPATGENRAFYTTLREYVSEKGLGKN